jgi:hypothetical protein
MIQQVTGQIKPFLELVRWSKSLKHQETAQAAGQAVIQIDSTSLITAISTVFMDVLSISAFLPPPQLAWQFATGALFLRRPVEVIFGLKVVVTPSLCLASRSFQQGQSLVQGLQHALREAFLATSNPSRIMARYDFDAITDQGRDVFGRKSSVERPENERMAHAVAGEV